jgi:hypothetical protein
MEERRKILIPLGHEPETPHFDAEETLLSARPVVPITSPGPAPVFNSSQGATRAPLYRRSAFLPLIVIAAIGIGLVAGLGIARYRYVQRSAAPVAAKPAPAPVTSNTPAAATVQPPKDEQQSQTPALPEVKTEEEKTDEVAAKADDNGRTATPGASEKTTESSGDKSAADREDNAKTPATAPRDKKRTGDDEEEEEAVPARAQRRERRVRNRNDETVDIPRRIERASEQINRIREIFEGRP